ncbi:hypothetical protein APICC_05063 [Apis cerana cerana]|uniref:Uncharacterized protein n=1 Tax=Apis cerana cerana TaxID=94128 RepID=A0A2A3E227_APICC|nr:hypothetical protein APICC_05063 [Apis cerana cerana]
MVLEKHDWHTIYELTMSCLSRKTHIIGTSKNKKFISKSILHCKLRKAEMISKENDNGIMGIMGCHTQMEKRYTRCENFIHETRFHHDYSNQVVPYATTIREVEYSNDTKNLTFNFFSWEFQL